MLILSFSLPPPQPMWSAALQGAVLRFKQVGGRPKVKSFQGKKIDLVELRNKNKRAIGLLIAQNRHALAASLAATAITGLAAVGWLLCWLP